MGKWVCLGLVPCKVGSVDLPNPFLQMFPAPSPPPLTLEEAALSKCKAGL